MRKIGKWIVLALIVSFLLGFLPTVIDIAHKFFCFTEEGFIVTPHFTESLTSALSVVEGYMWHIAIIYSLFVAFIIFLEGRNPDRTILWMLVLVFVPILGILLYLILGPDFRALRNKKHFRPEKNYSFDQSPFQGASEGQFLVGTMLHACSGAELTMKNRVKLLVNGNETFPALEAAIAAAKNYIHMEFFIIHSDDLGHRIGNLLKEAASRGVTVRVLYDAVGSWGIKSSFVRDLEASGITCRSFMPVSLPFFRRRMNYRNHRKIVVIDGRVAFTGGLNIGDEYEGKGSLGFWRDTFVRVEGEAAESLHDIFLSDWCACSKEKEEDIRATIPAGISRAECASLPTVPLQAVGSGVDSVWHTIAKGYYGMISRAKKRVWVTTPYLVPGPELMNALIVTSLTGVDVRVMIPEKGDHFLVTWAGHSNIEPLLRAGVRVFLYHKGFIHAKTAVSDRRIASIGTCNMDVRSLEINFENQLFIYDGKIADELASHFEDDMKDCRELNISEWEKRHLWQKMLESFGRLYSAQI